MSDDFDSLPSVKPYLIRSWHEWCSDNGLTPYLMVAVDASVRVPREFVQDGQIVLNTSFEATSHLQLGNDFIEFKARFGGVARDVLIPVSHVLMIFAREAQHFGMAFEPPPLQAEPMPARAAPALKVVPKVEAQTGSSRIPVPTDASAAPAEAEPSPPSPTPGKARKPSLKRVK